MNTTSRAKQSEEVEYAEATNRISEKSRNPRVWSRELVPGVF